MIDYAEAKQDAAELKIPEHLYIRWLELNTYILNFIQQKSKHRVVSEPNVHVIGGFRVFINFVNNAFLSLVIEKEDRDILQLRIPDRKLTVDDSTVICTHILLIIESY